ncbi:protein SRC2-like [Neltuma alba]|uniref:protein SRC2-like n=1 Tax=Neltuma alba TaxID=207710 RepID=UPI0010A4003F|nr:protein SRC2-like [Prosopis alba]XP_028807391.1 protein SRC2-like [Prosopis alba]
MGSRYEVEVKIESAKNLKNVNWRHGPNRPYAVVWVDPKNKCSTKVDESGDTDAYWDETLRIPLPSGPIEDLTLYIDVVHAGSEEDTKPLIGSAKLKLDEVLQEVGIGDRATRSLTLKRPSGRPQGKVDVGVSIREIGYPAPGLYYTPPYGVPPSSGSRDYYGAPPQDPYYSAPPPAGYPYSGYNAPSQPPMAYGQPNYSYDQGSQPAYVREEKKSKFGGMGTGLAVGAVAGALGGLALAEGFDALEDHAADEAAEKVEEDLASGDDF